MLRHKYKDINSITYKNTKGNLVLSKLDVSLFDHSFANNRAYIALYNQSYYISSCVIPPSP